MVSDLGFADDKGMLSGTQRGLQRLMDKLNDIGKG